MRDFFSRVSRILFRNLQISLRSCAQDICNSSSIGNPGIVPRISSRIPFEDLFNILPMLLQRFLLLIIRNSCSKVSPGIFTRFETSIDFFFEEFSELFFLQFFAGFFLKLFRVSPGVYQIFSPAIAFRSFFFRDIPVFLPKQNSEFLQ